MALPHARADLCGRACDAPMRTQQFCGVDGKCHELTCSEYFKYGPRLNTGYDQLGVAELTCDGAGGEKVPGQIAPRTGVLYGCDVPRSERTTGRIFREYTRKCSASGTVGGKMMDFTCREMAPDTDFGAFLSEVQATHKFDGEGDARVCPSGSSRTAPAFQYVWGFSNTEKWDTGYVTQYVTNTTDFNATLALKTISTELSFRPTTPRPPTPAPAPVPTTTGPAQLGELSTQAGAAGSSAVSIAVVSVAAACVGVMALGGLVWFVLTRRQRAAVAAGVVVEEVKVGEEVDASTSAKLLA
eukprot:TRINITY_DN3959_c0_g1_i1.p2 TRINITY_DN3959_c0_g1~~TRINITY_DN3959_c0_g1_i1.p2  ORF type:complete len:330 (+),score=85.04 TRINITY_DN3959_c0_g1_i1:94-990(+)